MSYERKILENLQMPTQKEVEQALLKSLFNNNGVIKEFGDGEKAVEEIADEFYLSKEQRAAYLETVYRRKNRVKRSNLWHRLLFRAANSLAKKNLVSRPTQTLSLTNKKEWMLTEDGYNQVLQLLHIPIAQKDILPIKSYEVEKIVKKMQKQKRKENYSPFESKKVVKITREAKIRNRAFSQAIKEVYNFGCAICGMKIYSPDRSQWEVEAAHIVPHYANGKDDIWNGIALCRLHHWAFDVGWFTLSDSFKILASGKIKELPADLGKLENYDFIGQLTKEDLMVHLPEEKEVHPHPNAVKWHRENIFNQ